MLSRLLSRRTVEDSEAPPERPRVPADDILDRLIEPEEVIDRFDATYVDDLPHILREVHGVTAENVREHELWQEIGELWSHCGRPEEEFSLDELPKALVDRAGVDPARHAPKQLDEEKRREWGYARTRGWRRASGIQLGRWRGGTPEGDRQGAVNTLQREFSRRSGGKAEETPFGDLARPETGDPWTPLVISLREEGIIRAGEPALTIGPRWVGEIRYFREELGLENAIGLDLFSSDESLVKVGDMHDMPFEDDTFALVYQRNTFDKSYDIRAALRECVRVLRDGGVLITDDCYAYTHGVSEISRTSIKHNRQVLRVLGENAGEVLYDEETPFDGDWIERVGQLALRIRK